MKKFLLLMVFSSLILTGCHNRNDNEAGVLTSINIIDRNGFSETISSTERLSQYDNVDFLADQPYQKVLRVYSRDGAGDVRAYITSYHPNGQPKQYLEVVNGRANGRYQEWYLNGQLKLEAYIVGGAADLNTAAEKTWLFDGPCQVWDEDANLMAKIPYCRGSLEGVSVYYHCNGNIWKSVPFCKGEINGAFEIFLENGDLLQRTNYVDGLKDGLAVRYWLNCTKASEECYSKDLLLNACYFDTKGNEVAKIVDGNGLKAVFGKESISEMHEYKDGVQSGLVKIYGKNGVLVKEYSIKNNSKNGEEIEYYPPQSCGTKPSPKLSVSWYEGIIQGVVKTWYANGVLESQREMSCNIKNGVSTAWYRDGSLMLIEEYAMDKLVKGEYFKKGEKFPVTEVRAGKGTVTLFDGDGNFLRKITYLNGKPGEQ